MRETHDGVRQPINIDEVRYIRRLEEGMPGRSLLEKFRPAYYRRPDDPHHGIKHTGEVVILATAVGVLSGERMNYYEVAKAAAYHDSHHSGKNMDFEHGELAAEWVMQNELQLPVGVRIHIAENVRVHVPHDQGDLTNEQKALKDGDALGRVRFSSDKPYSLDPSYLRFPSSHILIPYATELHRVGEELQVDGFGDGYSCAMEAGVKIGLVPSR